MNTATAARPRADLRDLLAEASNLSIDQVPMLPVMLDRAGAQIAERLRGLGSALPHVTLNSIETMPTGDALETYELRAIAGVMHVSAWDSRVVAGFDRDFVFTAAELLFGGDGTEPPLEEVRNFTGIEEQVAGFVFEQVATALQSAFTLAGNPRFRLERTETRLDFVVAGRRSNPAILARFILQAMNRGGEMFVIIPQAALMPHRQALSRVAAREANVPDPSWVKKISEEVQRTEVSVRAVIETSEFTLGDLADLKIGQVLRLPATTKSRVKVESSEQPLFWAYLGQNEGFHTLCIDEPIDPEREFINDVLAR